MLGQEQDDTDDYPEPINIIVPIYNLLNELFI